MLPELRPSYVLAPVDQPQDSKWTMLADQPMLLLLCSKLTEAILR